MEFDLNKTESDNEEQFKFDERKDGSNVTGYG